MWGEKGVQLVFEDFVLMHVSPLSSFWYVPQRLTGQNTGKMRGEMQFFDSSFFVFINKDNAGVNGSKIKIQ